LGAIGLFGSVYLGEQFRVWAQVHATRGLGAVGIKTPVRLIGFGITTFISLLMFLLMYTTVPTARVRLWPALGGAFVAAVLWEASKWGFSQYLHYSASYAKLYGALALFPLFLLWVYLTWVVVLVGLQIAYVLQYGLGTEEPKSTARLSDPASGVALSAAIARDFAQGKTVPAPEAARRVSVSLEAAEAVLGKLTAHGLVHKVRQERGGPEGYALARPPDRIAI